MYIWNLNEIFTQQSLKIDMLIQLISGIPIGQFDSCLLPYAKITYIFQINIFKYTAGY